jgi:lipopolysaccharide transport protein LptA
LFFKKDKVEKATFLKNVQIHTNDQVAYGDQAEYLQSSSLFKLTGNVRLTQDNAEIRGELFTYNINTKEAKIIAKGKELPDKKSGRVKAKFNINSKKDVGS